MPSSVYDHRKTQELEKESGHFPGSLTPPSSTPPPLPPFHRNTQELEKESVHFPGSLTSPSSTPPPLPSFSTYPRLSS